MRQPQPTLQKIFISEFIDSTEGHTGTYTIGFVFDDCNTKYYIKESDIEAVRAALLTCDENIYDLALSDESRHVIDRHVQPDRCPIAKIAEIEFCANPMIWKK